MCGIKNLMIHHQVKTYCGPTGGVTKISIDDCHDEPLEVGGLMWLKANLLHTSHAWK
jgi:hypothetical protein